MHWSKLKPRDKIIGITVFASLVLLLVYIWRFGSGSSEPFRHAKRTYEVYQGPIRTDDSIFISIASYRDSECLETVKEIYQKAKYPEKVFIGICQQNKTGHSEESCELTDGPWKKNLRILTLEHSEARGPTYARALLTSLWQGETFFFQIDSHTKFIDQWDEKIVSLWHSMKDPKVVFCHYPKSYDDKTDSIPANCKGQFQSHNGIFIMLAASLPPFPKPIKTYWGGANFLFGSAQMIRDVPFDPSLDMLFHGEEQLYSQRLFTHGYDIYAPNVNIAFHWYGREDKPKFWDDVEDRSEYQKMQNEAEAKVLKIIKGDLPNYPYGLGNVRTIQEFWQKVGVDPENPKDTDFCNKLT